MSQVRTPDLRKWIRIEIDPKGQYTRGMDIDLNMIDKVVWVRNSDGTIDSCKITSAAEMKPFILVKEEAQFFYEKWMEHSGIVEEMPHRQPGMILVGDTGNHFS